MKNNELLWWALLLCIAWSIHIKGDDGYVILVIGCVILVLIIVARLFIFKKVDVSLPPTTLTTEDSSYSVEEMDGGVYYFDLGLALGHLLSKNIFVLNTHWMNVDWPEEDRRTICLAVICNDIFGTGADAEAMYRDDIELLYRLQDHEEVFGVTAWCVHKRRKYPSSKVKSMMEELGWDFEELIETSSDDLLKKFRKGDTRVVL